MFTSLPQPWDSVLPRVTVALVWGMMFATIYLLRSFFLLIFLTFVFSYIQISGVGRLEKYFRSRVLRVVLVEIMVLIVLSMAAVFLVPKVKAQTNLFLSQISTYLSRVDRELVELSSKYPLLGEIVPELQLKESDQQGSIQKDDGNYSPTGALLQEFFKVDEETGGIQNVNNLIGAVRNIGGKIASVSSAFLLSLLFSFLIILDLPKLTQSVRNLEHTRLCFIYLSVADNIKDFSQVLGRALEAQLIIATINSILTAFGITALGLGENVAFLSVIVFFCSFIPVVGVFISSIPICLIALQAEGLQIMGLAILMITAIHLIEGYILNPRVYGSYMRINPVIVLIILTIGGKLFGFWGLLLGVPVCTYIFGHAIQRQKEELE
jgi:predicted PurR-regulated permease PerM